jgi:hypothetical protein
MLLRVHKTGSQSFRDAGLKAYRQRTAKPSFGHEVTPATLRDARFVAPHMSYQSLADLGDLTDWKVAITLRDPVKRLRSSFGYFQKKPLDHVTGVGRLLADMTYEDFLADTRPEVMALKDNIQVRFVGGGRFGVGAQGRNKLYSDPETTITAARDAALARCAAQAFTPLILERPDESLTKLAQTIGYSAKMTLPHLNKTKKGAAPIPQDAVPTPQEAPWVAQDLIFYDRALKMLG